MALYSAKGLENERREYKRLALERSSLSQNPFEQFNLWMEEALTHEQRDPSAFSLCTSTKDGKPSARIVLLKGLTEEGFKFYTNYESRKGQDILQNPHVAMLFYWARTERQVRVEGTITPLPACESDAYFKSRPLGSQLGAIASAQSRPLPDRETLESTYDALEREFSEHPPERPAHWGGYLVKPTHFEFWQGRENRLHDRFTYDETPENTWDIQRLNP